MTTLLLDKLKNEVFESCGAGCEIGSLPCFRCEEAQKRLIEAAAVGAAHVRGAVCKVVFVPAANIMLNAGAKVCHEAARTAEAEIKNQI